MSNNYRVIEADYLELHHKKERWHVSETNGATSISVEKAGYKKSYPVLCKDCANAVKPDETITNSEGKLDCCHFARWDYYNDAPGYWLVEPDGYCAWGTRRKENRHD